MATRYYPAATLRSLWLKSGNQCAYPTCQKTLLDDRGNFVGEIAHIEGLNPGSSRYNQHMTDEARNAPENLMMMCPTHHTEIDKDKNRTVLELKAWKNDHEKRYSDVGYIFQGIMSDYTAGIQILYPKNLKRLFPNISKDEMYESVECVKLLIDKLKPVPNGTKSFLAIAISRSHRGSFNHFAADLDEICSVASISPQDARSHINILETYRIAYYDGDDEPGKHLLCLIPDNSGWNIWEDIQKLFNKDSYQITKMLIDMDFTTLDK